MKVIITENQLEKIVKSLLNEGRVIDAIYNKNFNDIDRGVFDEIISADPKTNINKDIIGPGGKWLLNVYKKNKFPLEDLEKAREYLELYYRHKLTTNLQTLKSIPDLYNVIKDFEGKAERSIDWVLRHLSKNEYDKVFDGDNWVIYVPNTEKAAAWLGVNTQWCTTWGENSLNPKDRKKSNHFDVHNNDGPLYIIINKNDESEKYQFHFETSQFKDKSDDDIDLGDFLEKNHEVKSFFGQIGNQKLLNYKGGSLNLSNYIIDIEVLPDNIVEVDGNFALNSNSIKSLGNLEKVGRDLILYNCQIQSLGNLKEIGRNLYLKNTSIESLGDFENFDFDLHIAHAPIKSLGNLKKVGGDLWLYKTKIKSLGNLEYVGGLLNLVGNPIQSLGNLEYVGQDLLLRDTPLESLGNLETVRGNLHLSRTKIESLGKLRYVNGNINIYDTPLAKKHSIEELWEMYPKFAGKIRV